MSVGRLFRTRGAATANALSPNLIRVRGTYRSPLNAVRNEAHDGRSASGLIRSALYWGACPTSACNYVSVITLKRLHFTVIRIMYTCDLICQHWCMDISYQLATFMEIFTYKLATYLSTGDVAGWQNALFCGSCMVSRLCSGICESHKVAQVVV